MVHKFPRSEGGDDVLGEDDVRPTPKTVGLRNRNWGGLNILENEQDIEKTKNPNTRAEESNTSALERKRATTSRRRSIRRLKAREVQEQ